MPPQTIRKALADMLEDLSQLDFEKFCRQLLDRREEQRVRRSRVESKSFLDIADVLVSTFGEPNALQVAVEVLRQIDCNLDADRLVEETSALLSKSGSSDNIHFVDKHRTALINRVSNIAPILDELVDKNVIQQETYDRIRILPTTQEKMRELYSGCLKASGTCKDIFYKILEENEKYLIADLKNK
ncbi:apoptosis-associated speck-like protein containing a CARD isoform X2 [Siniperca chuatsi]|uniref:apoptosis-associated speck-like protein containing a CARD isoform X2 n=1 Tax=Siniperca chuatsi TaxID=119488 RepID=UPI001CE100D9|nr:apoptosis-associated speck-like protein containing a CARD isoform X2 [Siniperca chuatsi]